MIPLQISVTSQPTPSSRMTMRQLEHLLMLHSQEGRAGDKPALPVAAARRVTKTCACARCGAEFGAKRADAQFCSAACKQAAYRARKADERRKLATCAECGERFKPTNANHRFCCDNCKSRAWKRQRRAALRAA